MDSLIGNFFVLAALLWILGKSANWALRSAVGLSQRAQIPEVAISLVVVTLVSILPETVISALSALRGAPELGLGTLLGSNVADLAFVFGMVAMLSPFPLRVERTFIAKDYLFLSPLLLSLILGFTGHYSRLDGALLIAAGIWFFVSLVGKTRLHPALIRNHAGHWFKTFAILTGSLLILGISAHYTIQSAQSLSFALGLNPALIGLLIVALGTTLPELLFALQANRNAHPTLAVGDILGTVAADATIVLGIIALIQPFSFNPRIVIVTGTFMLLAGLFALSLLRSGKMLTRLEGGILLAFYAAFVIVEFVLRDWTPMVIR